MEPSQSAARRRIAESFREFDDGSKGWLTRNDLKCAVACLVGYKPSKVGWHVGYARWAERGEGDMTCGGTRMTLLTPFMRQVELGEILRAVPEGSVLDEAAFTACMEWRLGIQDPDERIRQIFKSFDYRCAAVTGCCPPGCCTSHAIAFPSWSPPLGTCDVDSDMPTQVLVSLAATTC